MNTPYSVLGKRAFWRTAVAKRSTHGFEGLYQKKYPISSQDRIATAGSCFAQHIARALQSSGFNFCDYEPAPPDMAKATAAKYNYSVFSARYCNIYTARQLLQTFERAFGERHPVAHGWTSSTGVVDPFRPALEPDPFEDETEMLASRASHYRCVRRVFRDCDVFIFTLGLTEAWVSCEDGSVFPLCPGTSGGTFDSAKYCFVNFSADEVAADLNLFVSKLRSINPGVRILLTVSPVPLVATASGNHVLVATTYSKSVLRAVAGEISASSPSIDYFPSFELIASPAMRGQYFDESLRTVTAEGVDFVMGHFFEQHAPAYQNEARADEEPRHARQRKREGDVVCEETLLDKGL